MPLITPARKFLALILTILLLPLTSSAQTILKYTDHEPLGGMRTRFIQDVFFTAIEKESHGRLKVDAHWNGELSNSYNALRTVQDGSVADMAIVVPEYAADKLPRQQLFKSFPVGPSGDKQVTFFRRAYTDIPAFPAELDQQNVVNLLITTGYPVAFLSTRPLNNLDEIKGQKWRTASFWHQGFLRNAGAIPVSMPWGEGVATALKDGSLDGLMVNLDSGRDINAQQAAPNVLVSKDLWLGHVYLLVMNKDTWNKLPKQDQQAIQRAAETAYKTLGSVMDKSFADMVADLQKEGVKIRLLDQAELAAWKAASQYKKEQAAWVNEQERKGVKDVGSVLKQVSVLLDEIER